MLSVPLPKANKPGSGAQSCGADPSASGTAGTSITTLLPCTERFPIYFSVPRHLRARSLHIHALLTLAVATASPACDSEPHRVETLWLSTIPAAGTAIPASSFSSPRGLRFPPEGANGYESIAVPSAGAVEAGSGSTPRGSVPPSEDWTATAMTRVFHADESSPAILLVLRHPRAQPFDI